MEERNYICYTKETIHLHIYNNTNNNNKNLETFLKHSTAFII